MTEIEWQTSTDPARMLAHLMRTHKARKLHDLPHISDRKLMLFLDAFHALGFCKMRRDQIYLAHVVMCVQDEPNIRFKPAVADLLRDIVGNLFQPMVLARQYITPTVLSLAEACYEERSGRRCERCKGSKRISVSDAEALQAMRDRHAYPMVPPQKRVDCPDCHATGRVEYGNLDPLRLAVLSDSLEESGCTEQAILDHLRSPGPHVRGMWSLDCILSKE